jgi:hypothetical protein
MLVMHMLFNSFHIYIMLVFIWFIILVPVVMSSSLFETMLSRRRKQYAMHDIPMIVIPMVKRKHNYLDACLRSVERTKGEMSVLLINGSPGFNPVWCSRFECIDAPPVSDNIFEKVFVADKRGDDKDFLQWRTKEAHDAMFAMRQFIKTQHEYMIWLQDDTYVHDLNDIPDHDATCLRTGKEYCGMVAFKLKRNIVIEFVKRIEKQYFSMPIDWILDNLRGDLGIKLYRFGKVDHRGKVSSNKRLRNAD